MRYYAIDIAGAPGAFTPTPDGHIWTTHPGGVWDPGAQQIDFQIEEYNASFPSENSTLTVYGVSFQQIKQSADLNGLPITVYGGMMPGLPIATYQSQHKGKLVEGRINRAWGNWVGTEMSIGMQITAAGSIAAGSGDSGAGGGGGGGGGGGNGGGGGSAGAQSVRLHRTGVPAAPVRYLRTGARSLDQRALPRGRMSPITRGPFVSPRAGNLPTSIVSAAGPAGTISGPSVGGTPFGTGTGFDFGAATSQIGGIVSSLIGGGGGPGGASGLLGPLNLIHNMMPNMPLSAAMQQTLSTALPMAKANINISPSLKLPFQDAGVYQNLQQYAQYIKNLSMNLLGGGSSGYPGVNITANGNTINVWDGTVPTSTGSVSILDLIGQPTWIGPQQVQIKTVLRADLQGGGMITVPPTLWTVNQGAIVPNAPEQRTNSSFTGSFLINRILYVGDLRNPDGNGWCAIYDAFIYGQGAGVTGAGSPLG